MGEKQFELVTANEISIVPLLKTIEERFNKQPQSWKKTALEALSASADQFFFRA